MTYKTVKDIICHMDKTARERGVKWMDSTMLLYALRWPEREAERILRYGGFEKVEDAYCLMERFDNEPLAEDENPRFTPVTFRLVEGGGQSARTIEKDSTHGLALPDRLSESTASSLLNASLRTGRWNKPPRPATSSPPAPTSPTAT